MKFLIAVLFLFLSSCATKLGEKAFFNQAKFEDLNGWKNDNFKGVAKAFDSSCKYFSSKEASYKIIIGPDLVNYASDWHKVCKKFETNNYRINRKFIQDNFVPYRISSSKGDTGIFTGYYEPDIMVSHTKDHYYKHPIYKYPDDRVIGIPYHTRQEIDGGYIGGRGLEMFYAKDKVDLFFLHIQGSGIINFEDGKKMRISYAGNNGHPYKGIGRILMEKGHIRKNEMSAEAIKKWLRHNPEHADDVMHSNSSYVFFKMNENHEHAVGAIGVPLIPERAMAVDRRYIPMGYPLWLDSHLPEVLSNMRPYNYKRLFFAQDVGGAIKGVIRGDIFFGNGKQAEKLASYMYSRGYYYILVPYMAKAF